MDTITLEAALDLFKLPRALGATAEGEPVSANIGRFGPYVRYANKFVSIKGDDPYTITFERALELIAEKKIADANRLIRDFPDDGIQVLNGRYGPYITNKIEERQDPEGQSAGRAHARGVPGTARRGARTARPRHEAQAGRPRRPSRPRQAAAGGKAKAPAKKKQKKKKKKKKAAALKRGGGAAATETKAADESPAE